MSAEEKTEEERAMDTARELRKRREAARGPERINKDLHRNLPLTRLFVPLFALTVLTYMFSRIGMRIGNVSLTNYASIACVLLFLMSFVVWFMSRHQAKVLTEEAHEREGIMTPKRAKAEAKAAKAAEKAAKKAAKKAKRTANK